MDDTRQRAARRLRPRATSGLGRLAVLLALGLAASGLHAAAEVDPFYRQALRDGTAAFEAGDHGAAVERLRIASFGMLDHPQSLAGALVRLALAQAALGQRDEFLATFERVSELADLYDAYARADLAPALRARFESQLVQWVPESVLEQSVSFAKLHRERELERLLAMLPEARAAELERLVAADPGNLDWQLMLARARVESGAGERAIDALETLPTAGLESRARACLLGRAYLQAGRCDSTLSQEPEVLASCDVRRLPTAEIARYLECLSAAERWPEAASIVVSLPAERRSTRPFVKWEKQIARALGPGFEAEVLPPFVAVVEAPPATLPVSPSAPIAAAPREPPEGEIEVLRQRANAAASVAELEAVAAAAAELASRFPEAVEPHYIAGEAAYRASDWQLAADSLQAAGGPPDDRPELLFYLSISLYELGDRDAAAKALRRALPGLEPTAIVERYRREILD